MGERLEALMRVVVGIVSGIILGLWGYAVAIVVIVHFFYALILGKKHQDMAKFANRFLSNYYRFMRYMYFASNKRPFPFTPMTKELEPVDVRKK